jgi:hypothetical protein
MAVKSIYLDGNAENDCRAALYESRGVSVSNRRSRSRRMNTKPYSGVPSAFQPLFASRSTVTAIANSGTPSHKYAHQEAAIHGPR